MIYGSVCSGIEAATVAWHPLGWTPAFFSEIEPFPRAVLGHHYPAVPLHGDFTTIREGDYEPIELLVGGTPCQAFSVAGLRKGLDDARGNLTLEFVRLAQRLRPRWVVWENVPGVLSIDRGRAFGSFLGGLAELGYGFAYRVLDAQHFGVPQRRRRVFVVGHLGDWRAAAAVLFERHSLQGHSAPRREAREGSAGRVAHSLRAGGFDASEDGTGRGTPLVEVAMCLNAKGGSGRLDAESETPLPVAYRTAGDGAVYEEGDCTAPLTTGTDPSAQIITFDTTQITSASNYSNPKPSDACHPLAAGAHAPAIAFQASQSGMRLGGDVHPTLDGNNGSRRHHGAMIGSAVRRLTPRECERLQGFPDDYTAITWRNKPAADGPRYKALGNSMAVPVMAWIGRRIQLVDALTYGGAEAA